MAKANQTAVENEAPASQSISISADQLNVLAASLNEVDTKISAASGNDTAARKAFIETVTSQNAEKVDATVGGLIEQLKAVEGPVLVGMVTRLLDRIKADLEPQVNSWVDEEFPKSKPDTTEDVDSLKEQRKALGLRFRALREVLTTFGINTDHIPEPKRSGGGRPPGSSNSGSSDKVNGPNKEKYQYSIDGKERPPSQNTFSSLAYYATEGCATDGRKRIGAKELKRIVADSGIDFPNQDEWELTLSNNKKVSARRLTDADYVRFGVDPSAPAPTDETPSADLTEAPVAV